MYPYRQLPYNSIRTTKEQRLPSYSIDRFTKCSICSKINCCALYPFIYLFFCFATCIPPMISMISPITARIIRTKNGLNEDTVSPCKCNPNNISFRPTIANTGYVYVKTNQLDYRLLVTNTAFPSSCTRKSTLIYY